MKWALSATVIMACLLLLLKFPNHMLGVTVIFGVIAVIVYINKKKKKKSRTRKMFEQKKRTIAEAQAQADAKVKRLEDERRQALAKKAEATLRHTHDIILTS
ncbi:MAG: hypothetical protein LBV12_11155, partial [Puniceicoccales bacterium]|nr:hypothetical protein [Puniceicoccales bacterium]